MSFACLCGQTYDQRTYHVWFMIAMRIHDAVWGELCQ